MRQREYPGLSPTLKGIMTLVYTKPVNSEVKIQIQSFLLEQTIVMTNRT